MAGGGGGGEKKKRIEEAVKTWREHDGDPNAIWTDGSKLESGGVGGAVTWYEEVELQQARLLAFDRRATVGLGARSSSTVRTYQDRERSYLEA